MINDVKSLSHAFFLLVFVSSASAETVIELSKPVSASLKPDCLYWPCDGGTIGRPDPVETEDLSGNGYTGKLQPGKIHPEPVYAAGKFGTALRFHGPTPPVMGDDGKETLLDPSPSVIWRLRDTGDVSDDSKLDLAGKSFTAGLWIKFEKLNQGGLQSVLLMNRGYLPDSQWNFVLVKDVLEQWTMRVLRTQSSQKTDILNDGEWHHVAFSLEAHAGGITVTYWLDGVILGEPVTSPSVIGEVQSDAERIFRVGERNVANFSTGFAGMIDDIFVTNGVHTFQP